MLFVHDYDAHPPFIAPSVFSEIFDPGGSHTGNGDGDRHGFGVSRPTLTCAPEDIHAPDTPVLWYILTEGLVADIEPAVLGELKGALSEVLQQGDVGGEGGLLPRSASDLAGRPRACAAAHRGGLAVRTGPDTSGSARADTTGGCRRP